MKRKTMGRKAVQKQVQAENHFSHIFYSHISIPGASNLNEASFPLCLILLTPSQILRSEDKIINQLNKIFFCTSFYVFP